MKRKRIPPLSDQLRSIIEQAGTSRYRLAKDSKVDAGQLCRFMQGKVQLTLDTLDRIGLVMGLRLVVEPASPPPGSNLSPKKHAAKKN